MDTNELKKLLKGSTAVLILEDGEPSYVILGYDAYKNLIADQEKEIKINHAAQASNGQLRYSQTDKDRVSAEPSGLSVSFQNRISEKESEFLEKINKQILSLKGEIDKEEKDTNNPHID